MYNANKTFYDCQSAGFKAVIKWPIGLAFLLSTAIASANDAGYAISYQSSEEIAAEEEGRTMPLPDLFADDQYGPNMQNGSCPNIPTTFRNTVFVSSAPELRSAVANAQPGDAVIIRNGVYHWKTQVELNSSFDRVADRPLVLDGYGTSEAPVYILPESMHGVEFPDSGVDWVLTGQNMVIAGFKFRMHGALYVVNSDNRIACNLFSQTRSKYVVVENANADRTEIDNNDFNDAGYNALILWRCNPAHSACRKNSKGAHIHHNTFRNKQYTGTNGHEAIVLGLGYAPIEGVQTYNVDGMNMDAVIENNLFDGWNGEVELITIKSSRNIIRNNCVINSPKANFVLRNGNDNLITGNWMENANGGISMSGRGNTIVFNYKGRKSGDYFGFRFHTGESRKPSFRPGEGFEDLYAYIDASNNVIRSNVFSGIKFLVDTPAQIGHVFQAFPHGNTIVDNHIYTADFRGTETSGGYYNRDNRYSESEFRRLNSWGSNPVTGYELGASACGNPNLFDGPGGGSATYQGGDNLLGGSQTITAPSWW